MVNREVLVMSIFKKKVFVEYIVSACVKIRSILYCLYVVVYRSCGLLCYMLFFILLTKQCRDHSGREACKIIKVK